MPGMDEIGRLIRSRKAATREPFCAYLYDLARLQEHVRRLRSALPPGCRLFYAMKANPETPILAALAPLIDGFEAASLGEIEKARQIRADVPLLFGGPVKTDGAMAGALRHGVDLIHVESVTELRRVDRVAAELGVIAAVLLRINPEGPLPASTLRMGGAPTQFGIEEPHAPEAIALAKQLSHVALRGFHFHAISNNLDATAHAELVAHYVAKASAWAKRFDLPVSCLNAGGGIGIDYTEGGRRFSWDAFCERLGGVLGDVPRSCDILFECGRYLVAECGTYAAEVMDIKKNHGSWFVLIRGGTHHFRLPASWQHSHPFAVLPVEGWSYRFPRPEVRDCKITVAGELCSPKDILARDVAVERVRAGDVLLFSRAGAYGWHISHHDFLSHPHPEFVYLGG